MVYLFWWRHKNAKTMLVWGWARRQSRELRNRVGFGNRTDRLVSFADGYWYD